MQNKFLFVITIFMGFNLACLDSQEHEISTSNVMPEITSQNKPWTRWWWMGSAVDSINIKQNLIDLNNVGIGGVEIAPIYGVKGEEENFIDYLSPRWMDMLSYTVFIADSLDMGVDLTLGTGWPYGGPQVTPEFAATKLLTQIYTVKKGTLFNKSIKVDNPREKQPASLKYVLAYGENGDYLDLTTLVKADSLNWKAENDTYTLYAVFVGKTGQTVKRAAPGGDGYTLDHYSTKALNTYVERFDEALGGFDGKVRSIFNDSFEVYGADFTPDFFEAFSHYRGYDLKPFLPLLLSKEDSEENNRLRSDYRETLSDLLLHRFNEPWTNWAHKKQFKTRLQAHGSPGNLIDLYASADIPECETFGSMPYDILGLRREQEDIREGDADPVMLKFSSSAAHISGKPLTSSETFTWLRDHFKTALSQCKPEVEDLFINGVNHVFLHGTTYSPSRAEWPGWKFYASVNFNPRLGLGEDESQLFSYIANCQALLQSGTPDNETLLYWPVYDNWSQFSNAALFYGFPIHSKKWLLESAFYQTANNLMNKGYGIDFISDKFIETASFKDGKIQVPGGSYKSLIIPPTKNMPLRTVEKLLALKAEGANIFFESLPETVPGFNNYKEKNTTLQNLFQQARTSVTPTKDLSADLKEVNVLPEKLVETGLKYIRRAVNGDKIYYLVNHTSKTIDDYIPINYIGNEVVIYDPNTSNYGKAKIKELENSTLVKIQLASGESLFLKTAGQANIENWRYFDASEISYNLSNDWDISFIKGGPILPENTSIPELKSWTTFSNVAEAFSGTATYATTIENPDTSIKNWQLNLGDVRESAKIWINEQYIGTVWANPFTINIGTLKKGTNKIKLEVTNLSANRIRTKELRGEEWKNFYEINMVDKDYKKFDATQWNPMPSGLLGPISLTPLKENK